MAKAFQTARQGFRKEKKLKLSTFFRKISDFFFGKSSKSLQEATKDETLGTVVKNMITDRLDGRTPDDEASPIEEQTLRPPKKRKEISFNPMVETRCYSDENEPLDRLRNDTETIFRNQTLVSAKQTWVRNLKN